MIRPVTFYQAVCDRCGFVDNTGDTVAWADPIQAEDVAVESEWLKLEDGPDQGKLLCSNCWTWADDDTVVAKPAVRQ